MDPQSYNNTEPEDPVIDSPTNSAKESRGRITNGEEREDPTEDDVENGKTERSLEQPNSPNQPNATCVDYEEETSPSRIIGTLTPDETNSKIEFDKDACVSDAQELDIGNHSAEDIAVNVDMHDEDNQEAITITKIPEEPNGEVLVLASPLQKIPDTRPADPDSKATDEPVSVPPLSSMMMKLPTLEGDDAELISEFLSRAKAKRAAAAATKSETAVVHRDIDNDVIPQSPTPRQRRVLKDLDKNSPSSPRCHVSPSKLRQVPSSPLTHLPERPVQREPENEDKGDGEEEEEDEEEEAKEEKEKLDSKEQPQQASAVRQCRRSTRTTVKPQRHIPAVPNQIPLRRSNGTEFVFLQKTEAQRLALTTKANTKRNKGDAQLPHKVLPGLQASESNKDDAVSPRSTAAAAAAAAATTTKIMHKKSTRKQACGRKKVTWDDRHLVQYEGEILSESDMETNQDGHSPDDYNDNDNDDDYYDDDDNIVLIKKKKNNGGKSAPQANTTTTITTTTTPSTSTSTSNSTTLRHQRQRQPQLPKSPVPTRKIRKLGISDTRNLSINAPHNNQQHHHHQSSSSSSSITASSGNNSGSPGTPRVLRNKLAPRSQKGKASTVIGKVPEPPRTTSTTTAAAVTTATTSTNPNKPRHSGNPRTRSTKISGTPISKSTKLKKV